jgi:hypothetical protein
MGSMRHRPWLELLIQENNLICHIAHILAEPLYINTSLIQRCLNFITEFL